MTTSKRAAITASTLRHRPASQHPQARTPAPAIDDTCLGIPTRANLVANALGSRAALATLLRVPPQLPSKWIKGQQTPNAETTRAIIDLEHVITRARMLWRDDDNVKSWLTTSNGYLDGARPVDVIATHGSSAVIDALDQATAGAFA